MASMAQFIVIWLITALFCSCVFWGSNVPTNKRTYVTLWILSLYIVVNVFAQGYFFRVDTENIEANVRNVAMATAQGFDGFLNATTFAPGKLFHFGMPGMYRAVSSSFIHYGWIHLLLNTWFFVLFAHVVEHTIGVKRFLGLFAVVAIVPVLLDGLIFSAVPSGLKLYTGGMGGIVYGMMGAYLMLFPRSKFYGAVSYDLKFWGAIFCILLPVTYVAQMASLGLAETVIIMGVVAAYLLIQPEASRVALPAFAVVIYKYLIDVIFVREIIDDVLINTHVRMLSGLLCGALGAYCIAGIRGWKLTWETPAKSSSSSTTGRIKMSVARLESEGRKSAEGARVYLGQRVFVGDVDRAVIFYREVVIPKFPDLLLPMQEHIALARLLHFKGHDVEALKAYETMLDFVPELPDEYWIAWLKAAELTMKLTPDDTAKARHYLDQFELGTANMMRDRVEAQRLRATLPVVEDSSVKLHQFSPSFLKTAAQGESLAEAVGGSDAEAPICEMDVVRIRPRTFVFVPGAAPVLIAERQVNLPQPELNDLEFLNQYWKPLPSLGDKNPTTVSMLERRIKNPRVAESDEESASMYQALTGNHARRSLRKSRVAQLEVAAISPVITPLVKDAPGAYGGITEVQGPLMTERFRLRGEKETPNERHRASRPEPQWDKQLWRTLAVDMPEDEMAMPEYSDDLAASASALSVNPADECAIWTAEGESAELVSQFIHDQMELLKLSVALESVNLPGADSGNIFLSGVPQDVAITLMQAAESIGLKLHTIQGDAAMFRMEPLEVLEITLDQDGMQLKTMYGNRRLTWGDPALVALSHLRLTPDSRSLPRWMLEIICLGDNPTRFQVFERTIATRKCQVGGQRFEEAMALINTVAHYIWDHVKSAVPLPVQLDDLENPALQFESYRAYNERILYKLANATISQH